MQARWPMHTEQFLDRSAHVYLHYIYAWWYYWHFDLGYSGLEVERVTHMLDKHR